MKSLVVYDSKFGNTKLIAEEIARVLAEQGEVRIVHASEAASLVFSGEDLLVMGGPTTGHGLSPNMRVLLDDMWDQTPGRVYPQALAFDTRLDWPKLLSGSATDKIADSLREIGCTMIGRPGSFIVDGGEGPLGDGELERAVEWVLSAVEQSVPVATTK